MKKENRNMKSFVEQLDEQYGKRGTAAREQYEQGFETFKLGVMLQEMRKNEGLTQVELAERCGTTQKYISRIENNDSNIRLSTLMKVISEGLGRQLVLNVQ